MPVPAGTFSTGRAVGNREDLLDKINMITPTETPFYSLAGSVTAKGVKHEWQTDALAAQDLNNAQLEGDDATGTPETATARVENACQISRKIAVVSETQEAVDKAGRDSDMDYLMAKKGMEIRIDIEGIISGVSPQNNGTFDGNGYMTAARKTRGFEHWVQSNKVTGVGYVAPASATAAMTDGTQVAFTETMLLDTLQSCYTNGGKPMDVFLGPKNKRAASAFAGRASARQAVADGTILQTASLYASDFGDITLRPSLYTRARTALLVDKRYHKIAWLRRLKRTPLAKNGDNMREMLIGEYCYEMGNEKAHGKVADLTV